MMLNSDKVNLFDGISTEELKNDLVKYRDIAGDKPYIERWFAYEMVISIARELLTREENKDDNN
jgi:hypothetical protein